jgi:hypothetical protein
MMSGSSSEDVGRPQQLTMPPTFESEFPGSARALYGQLFVERELGEAHGSSILLDGGQ